MNAHNHDADTRGNRDPERDTAYRITRNLAYMEQSKQT